MANTPFLVFIDSTTRIVIPQLAAPAILWGTDPNQYWITQVLASPIPQWFDPASQTWKSWQGNTATAWRMFPQQAWPAIGTSLVSRYYGLKDQFGNARDTFGAPPQGSEWCVGFVRGVSPFPNANWITQSLLAWGLTNSSTTLAMVWDAAPADVFSTPSANPQGPGPYGTGIDQALGIGWAKQGTARFEQLLSTGGLAAAQSYIAANY